MNSVIDFFVVRPVFTLFSLRALWVAYLFEQTLTVLNVLANPALHIAASALFVIVLHLVITVVSFRLLIEVAAVVLLGRPGALRNG